VPSSPRHFLGSVLDFVAHVLDAFFDSLSSFFERALLFAACDAEAHGTQEERDRR